MGNIINSRARKLSKRVDFDWSLIHQLKTINYTVVSNNLLSSNPENNMPMTPYGRALFSILEELTGDVVSRGYIDEKLDIMFGDE